LRIIKQEDVWAQDHSAKGGNYFPRLIRRPDRPDALTNDTRLYSCPDLTVEALP